MKQMAVCMAILLALCSIHLNAQIPTRGRHQSLYTSVGLGAGVLDQNFIVTNKSNTRFGASLVLAFFINPWLQIGGTATGWGYESENLNNWTKGVYISNSLVHARIYPMPKAGLFTSAGIGFSSYSNRNPGNYYGYTSGPGYMVNLGYDHHIKKHSRIIMGTSLSYHWGRINDNPARELRNAKFNTYEFLVFVGWD